MKGGFEPTETDIDSVAPLSRVDLFSKWLVTWKMTSPISMSQLTWVLVQSEEASTRRPSLLVSPLPAHLGSPAGKDNATSLCVIFLLIKLVDSFDDMLPRRTGRDLMSQCVLEDLQDPFIYFSRMINSQESRTHQSTNVYVDFWRPVKLISGAISDPPTLTRMTFLLRICEQRVSNLA